MRRALRTSNPPTKWSLSHIAQITPQVRGRFTSPSTLDSMQALASSQTVRAAVATRPATRATRAPAAGRVATASSAAAAPAARLSMRTSVSNTSALRAAQPMQTSASRNSVKVHAGLFSNKEPAKYGKTVIITGASSGLGLATAQSLIEQVCAWSHIRFSGSVFPDPASCIPWPCRPADSPVRYICHPSDLCATGQPRVGVRTLGKFIYVSGGRTVFEGAYAFHTKPLGVDNLSEIFGCTCVPGPQGLGFCAIQTEWACALPVRSFIRMNQSGSRPIAADWSDLRHLSEGFRKAPGKPLGAASRAS